MGTQQELTTEQIEVLILIDDISNYVQENKVDLLAPMSEVIDDMGVAKDSCEEICEVLKHYGYIVNFDDGYKLTQDGKQYIRLFKEYLSAKAENVQFIHNSYSLINIGKLKVNLEACLGKVNISTGLSDFLDFMKDILKKKDN